MKKGMLLSAICILLCLSGCLPYSTASLINSASLASKAAVSGTFRCHNEAALTLSDGSLQIIDQFATDVFWEDGRHDWRAGSSNTLSPLPGVARYVMDYSYQNGTGQMDCYYTDADGLRLDSPTAPMVQIAVASSARNYFISLDATLTFVLEDSDIETVTTETDDRGTWHHITLSRAYLDKEQKKMDDLTALSDSLSPTGKAFYNPHVETEFTSGTLSALISPKTGLLLEYERVITSTNPNWLLRVITDRFSFLPDVQADISR